MCVIFNQQLRKFCNEICNELTVHNKKERRFSMTSRKRKRNSSNGHKAGLEQPYSNTKEEDKKEDPIPSASSVVMMVEWRDRTRDEFTREYIMIEM